MPVQAEAQATGHGWLFLKWPPQVTMGEGRIDTDNVTYNEALAKFRGTVPEKDGTGSRPHGSKATEA